MDEKLTMLFDETVDGVPIKIEQYQDGSFLMTTTQQEDDLGDNDEGHGSSTEGVKVGIIFKMAGEVSTYEPATVDELKRDLETIGLNAAKVQTLMSKIGLS